MTKELLFQNAMPIKEYEALKERFRRGDLWEEWSGSYSQLFLDNDLETLGNQAHQGFHFHEFLSAVLILERMGHLSLVEKYQWANHQEKHDVIACIDSAQLDRAMQFIHTEIGGRYGPDLLVYSTDFSDWFFCEVKGPQDGWNKQQTRDCSRLAEITRKPVRLMKFRTMKNQVSIILWEDFHHELSQG